MIFRTYVTSPLNHFNTTVEFLLGVTFHLLHWKTVKLLKSEVIFGFADTSKIFHEYAHF